MTIALVVTHASPDKFLDSVGAWLSQVNRLLVVDNGSTLEWRNRICKALEPEADRVEFIFNDRNLGIAAALNIGFAWLLDRGFQSAFVSDQDSRPAPGMVSEMLDLYRGHSRTTRIAIVAPNVSVPSARATASFLVPRGPVFFQRVRPKEQRVLDDVSIVISSGALYDLGAYRDIGPFREDFFVDYVDTDYCLRAKQRGYHIVVACRATLIHQLGDQKEARVGPLTMHPTFHSPLRWYYISRNRVPMLLTYAWRWPHWFFYELFINAYGLVRLILFEDHKLAKFLAIILGTWDGLLRRLGPVSPGRQALFVQSEPDS